MSGGRIGMTQHALLEDDLAPFGEAYGPGLMNNFAPLRAEFGPARLKLLSGCPSSDDLRQRSVFGSEALAHLV